MCQVRPKTLTGIFSPAGATLFGSTKSSFSHWLRRSTELVCHLRSNILASPRIECWSIILASLCSPLKLVEHDTLSWPLIEFSRYSEFYKIFDVSGNTLLYLAKCSFIAADRRSGDGLSPQGILVRLSTETSF